jgi:hypothetical protein
VTRSTVAPLISHRGELRPLAGLPGDREELLVSAWGQRSPRRRTSAAPPGSMPEPRFPSLVEVSSAYARLGTGARQKLPAGRAGPGQGLVALARSLVATGPALMPGPEAWREAWAQGPRCWPICLCSVSSARQMTLRPQSRPGAMSVHPSCWGRGLQVTFLVGRPGAARSRPSQLPPPPAP